jgi:hypothetical protein
MKSNSSKLIRIAKCRWWDSNLLSYVCVLSVLPLLQHIMYSGNTKGGSIIIPLTSCLTGLDKSVLEIKTKLVSCHTADSEPVTQEVNGTVIIPPLVFPDVLMNTHSVTL